MNYTTATYAGSPGVPHVWPASFVLLPTPHPHALLLSVSFVTNHKVRVMGYTLGLLFVIPAMLTGDDHVFEPRRLLTSLGLTSVPKETRR